MISYDGGPGQPPARPVTSQIVDGGAPRASLINLPEMPVGDDHMAPILDNPQVPEHKRFCSDPECRHQVGRARNGRSGLVEGFCPQCRTRFSFRPPLLPGVLVGDGQFKVEGAIAHGGLGWVYRAWDCWVPRWVVLKGLIDPDDPDNRQAAVAELVALADASHPNIVTVHTVVRHPHPLTGKPVDYIVMEYLGGKSLKQLRHERPDGDSPLPVDQVCGFALEVLAALDHLHDKRGLLYCDLSADNVIYSTSGVKLIDLGAVRRIDDSNNPVFWGKAGYQDPMIATSGPSVATDLYTVGRMMAELSFPFPGFHTDAPIPRADEVPLLAEHPSFARLLRRATNPDPQCRFASAADMAEQLEGVLREVRARQEDRPFPAASTRFGPELRVVGADPDTFPAGEPDTVAAALALPDPKVNPADPHAGLLAAIRTEIPDEAERVLAALPHPSLETRLRVVRARIELHRPEAEADLVALAADQPGDWRVAWFQGIRGLINGSLEAARQGFTAVLVADFFTAAEQLDSLELDDQRRELAVAEVLETILAWERAGRPWPHAAATPLPATVLGHRLNERGVRDRLESAYRELARLAPITAERITFVDKANDRRNRSWT
ncbi:MAG: tetratricopeptide repeat protein [Pseudonocardiaceae bacterium]